ncbi:glutamate-rich WD repeat-containing protein [Vararia minispora EC-137]|uniref:Glutamate-rich WD repeat-containing protein n=1 Tax=Vararia minispora EC-137 TaxID=1314806 RepID=A0ACB8QQM9_9AGAM|nr:glutamate-rich WD repeat-containing protein [Vararia minispora EC-137]
MSKRVADPADISPAAKASRGGQARKSALEQPGMGEFEDQWEDEIEGDQDDVDEDGACVRLPPMVVDDDVTPAIEDTDESAPAQQNAFLPGVHKLAKDEILEPDDSVYIMRHSLNVTWPCLSFDILRDSLGDERQRYPATAYLAAGTQADAAKNNELIVYKLSSLHKTQRSADSDDDDDADDDDDDDRLDEDPVLEFRSVPHPGGVNRVRAQPLPPGPLPPPTQPYHVATWAETGKVHIWDVRPLIESLDVPGYAYDKARAKTPVFSVAAHGRAEGFALDWASSASGTGLRLLSGDTHAKIFLTTSTVSGFSTSGAPFASHTASVEDLQWSPSEPTVFASCSADRSVRVWDVRSRGRKSVASVDGAHDGDVNVISWNRASSYLLLSGGDEGGLKVWDLRNVKKHGAAGADPTPVAHFTWHKAPITSVEWHPTEDSLFAASGADDQLTLWDLAVEQDDEEVGGTVAEDPHVPPQLLFVHQGQRDIKELHWHPQIPGTVVSTALDGFDIFKTISA